MPNKFIATTLAATLLAGCASAPHTPTTAVDYTRQTYEGTRYEKKGMNAAAQQSEFKVDIDSCEAEANQNYQASLARSAKLAQLYGQPVNPETLAAMKRLQVVTCMAGDRASPDKGKGWAAVPMGK
ncbi:hypothetical protein [Pseudomonas sp. KNUC1026]|uniref:hypothetical protein n=1 Tax=Pseudomonas sp. KNUC1026 TaxID=2893890 RepID=UPI001F48B5BB|nr:hypothetical protein [Pseudomonas sp. KNUC1026]UFH50510.1 hypothetical protein LN139_04520 [Pseudomonas sp. KNUC1026]